MGIHKSRHKKTGKKTRPSVEFKKRPKKFDDERHEAMKNVSKTLIQVIKEADEETPGCGEYYCIPCDRHFIDLKTREKHSNVKLKKKLTQHLLRVQ